MRKRWPGTALFVSIVLTLTALVSRLNSEGASQKAEPQNAAEIWLSWSPEARSNYVRGYLAGFEAGKHDGCSYHGEKMAALPEGICLDALPNFTAPYFGVYVDEMTAYYTKYPSDYKAGWPVLLHEMAASPGITVEQIYAKRHVALK